MASATFLGQSAEEVFKQWLAKYPEGYCLNLKSKQAAMLHRADCGHFVAGEGVRVTSNSKVCADNAAELTQWANDNGIEILHCPDCRSE